MIPNFCHTIVSKLWSLTFLLMLTWIPNIFGQDQSIPSLESKIEGMLIGSAIGDAAGGPVEFVVPPERSYWSTTDQKITKEGIEALGGLFKLRPYR